jgi:ABC-type uncharacterized transport system involved in gliding motility auxiliary subunit
VVLVAALDSTHYFFRADLTEDRIFTISKVSRALFREIPQQIHINYYISGELRQATPVPGQIIDLLQEYAADSHGKIRVSIVDPSSGPAAEAVHRFGIVPQQIKIIKQNEQKVAEVYSGLEIEYLDRSIAVPFVFNPETLEYSLTLTIRRILQNSPAIVSVLIGNPQKTLQSNYSTLSEQLSRSFKVRPLEPGATVPPETSVLVVLGGTQLTKDEVLPIDQFIMSGGHVLFAVKALTVDTSIRLIASAVASSPLLDMLAHYGIDVGNAMVLDQSNRDYRVPQNILGNLKWMSLGSYPEWVSVLPEDVSLSNPITRRFSGLDLLWPSPLHFEGGNSVKAEVIVKSSKNAWLLKPPYQLDPLKVTGRTGAGDPTKGQYALAYALSGKFGSFFGEDRKLLSTPKDTPYGKLLTESPDTRMIVIGDDDFASDLMQFSDSGYNALFMDNAVEWLSADADLLSIKTRNFRDPRLNRIQDPSKRNKLIILSEGVNVVLVPLLVLIAALVRTYSRREQVMIARDKRRKRIADTNPAGGGRRRTKN